MKVLIIGYGSIGRRHANILNSHPKVRDLKVFTSQKNIKYKRISLKSEILKFDPDYFIISNETNLHLNYLKFLENNFKHKDILVEKPIFNKNFNFKVKNNRVFVGYNLRFHPILGIIQKKIKKKKIWSINIITGSYLPKWRKNREYSKSYSSQKNNGGVLLDLSHEIDYLLWLIGDFKKLYSINKKISNLKIKSNDFYSLFAISKSKIYVNLSLNYFYKIPIRQIIIEGHNISLKADLINNNLNINTNRINKYYNFKNFDLNKMYLDEHNEIIYQKYKNICRYEEALNTMKIIDRI